LPSSPSHLRALRNFAQPPAGHRDWYAFEALRALPRLILMVDKNPFSKTYGSFDRSYWHYRTMDFPCGMNQEYALPLALAHTLPMPGNIYHGSERLRELVEAGIDYARKSSHRDGTCDDYFPFERALGAVVFALYSMTESAIELGLRDERHLEFFDRRAKWLATHNESGQLANHQAFAALALYNVYILTGDTAHRKASDEFRDLTLSWQKDEGWFQEYEGADPGYHTCTIGFLSKLWQKSQDESLMEPLGRAVRFAHHFMHPDGSYGGEYGSRNTFHFYPHGFEVLSHRIPEAGRIAEAFLQRAMPERRRYFNDDDRMAAHYVYDWMQAWRDYSPERHQPLPLPQETEVTHLEQARMSVVRTPVYHAVIAANKGGAFKATTPDGPLASDTGLVAELEDGTVAVMHIVADNRTERSGDGRTIKITGRFQRRRQPLPTPFKQIVFRVLNLTIGRFNPNLVRSTLQRILITGKAPLPLAFRRTVTFDDDKITITDEIRTVGNKPIRLKRLAASSDATSIYVANSNVYQDSVLTPWVFFEDETAIFNKGGRVTIKQVVTDSASTS
jgi:hypothetical protein